MSHDGHRPHYREDLMYPDDDELGTLPQWLYQRFGAHEPAEPHQPGPWLAWDDLTDDDWKYWEHEARAVLRAARRGGFRVPVPT